MATNRRIRRRLIEAQGNVTAVLNTLMTYPHHVSVAALADAFGVSRQAMYQRLNGKSRIDADELPAYADFFGVPVAVFYMDPDEALRWVLDHRSEVEKARIKIRCVAVLLAGGTLVPLVAASQ